MSMLAGPRVKQKISANPRGTAWSNDESKFGQKLMEKFGWTKGKGLGAKEDGNVDHITVMKKMDSRGVGCSKSHADNWIAHQDDFNSLLASLNDNQSQDSAAVISLEKKSKSSRSRVHYQKFTKGKDLSGKSTQDLDCIFGKRKSNSETNTPELSDGNSSDEQDSMKHGVITVRSNDSVQDYFAKKMAELKKKTEGSSEPCKGTDTGTDESDTGTDESDTGSGISDNKVKISFTVGDSSEEECATKVKKQKKKRKQDLNEKVDLPKKKVRFSIDKLCEYADDIKSENQEEATDSVNVVEDDINNNDKSKKKKKKKKAKSETTPEDSGIESQGCEDDHSSQKKKKKRKSQSENNIQEVVESKPKKKKKNSQKLDSVSEVSEDNSKSEHDAKKVSKKKDKKVQNIPDIKCFFDKSMKDKLQKPVHLPPDIKTVVDSFTGSNLDRINGYAFSSEMGQALLKKKSKKKNNRNRNRIGKQKKKNKF